MDETELLQCLNEEDAPEIAFDKAEGPVSRRMPPEKDLEYVEESGGPFSGLETKAETNSERTPEKKPEKAETNSERTPEKKPETKPEAEPEKKRKLREAITKALKANDICKDEELLDIMEVVETLGVKVTQHFTFLKTEHLVSEGIPLVTAHVLMKAFGKFRK
ncbi:TATA box-binding protein-associated factor RNA polymerase I subunit C-like [Amblyomma americanum]